MSLLGHDFGIVPMGIAQIQERWRRDLACCGDPGDCAGPCSSSRPPICICDPELLGLSISDIRCFRHGLVPFLKGALNRGTIR